MPGLAQDELSIQAERRAALGEYAEAYSIVREAHAHLLSNNAQERREHMRIIEEKYEANEKKGLLRELKHRAALTDLEIARTEAERGGLRLFASLALLPLGLLLWLNASRSRAVHSARAKQLELKADRDQLRKALSEADSLRGLLPICSGCNSIRDAENCWGALDTYIGRQTGATFSHDICPRCVEKHYDLPGLSPGAKQQAQSPPQRPSDAGGVS